jgi:hypothetical protein
MAGVALARLGHGGAFRCPIALRNAPLGTALGGTWVQCQGDVQDGVLEVRLPAPKQPERSARQIPVC